MKRRPADPRLNPVYLAMPMNDVDRRQAETLVHLALAEFEAGGRGHQVLRELLLAAGTCSALANAGIGPEAFPVGMAAIEALGADDPDIEALRLMVDTLDEQRRLANRGQLIRAAGSAIAALN